MINDDVILSNEDPTIEVKEEPEVEEWNPHKHRMYLAYYILLGSAILFLISMILYAFNGNKDIFDGCKTILPPIATLIIGYYFSEKNAI